MHDFFLKNLIFGNNINNYSTMYCIIQFKTYIFVL
ncbi:hypothetical protein HDF23_004587 [Mucilaginibacter lappiensis]|uniref:Uncharacterized protein n=1 Tax=Mucilaginibacter lappiensis TaxID=354630 RepID=A0ABR6PPX0_9SPHI|nr:hypothetical protein [Mucilaginibacter lappiensis]